MTGRPRKRKPRPAPMVLNGDPADHDLPLCAPPDWRDEAATGELILGYVVTVPAAALPPMTWDPPRSGATQLLEDGSWGRKVLP